MTRRIKLGVIADEFFDLRLGRMGGFGWSTRELSRVFSADPSLGVDLVFLSSEMFATDETNEITVHDTRLLLRRKTRWQNARAIRREHFDLLLTIDYNVAYTVYLRSLPRTPTIVWVRDPWSPDDVKKIATLRIPGAEGETPQGRHSYDGSSLARIAKESEWLGRKLLIATPYPHLASRLAPTYGIEPWNFYCLRNPIQLDPGVCVKSERATAVFLARLDPIKRPWLFAELARRFPEVEFLFLGQPHFSGPGSWRPGELPTNIRMMGHVDGAEKLHLLSSAWVAINTSIHESQAVSLLEALSCETPLLSCLDPGFVISRHGIYVGRFDGSGMDSIDALSQGLRTLLDNREMRTTLGRSGREWVQSTHSRERFLEAFWMLCERAGVAR
jgi:glycosyltransferase involved in cell wall biosynthesis